MSTLLYKIGDTTFGICDVTWFKLEGSSLTVTYEEKTARCDSNSDIPVYYTDYTSRNKFISGISEAVIDGVRIK